MPHQAKQVELDQQSIAEAVQQVGSRAELYLREPAKAKQLLADATRKAGEHMPTEGPLVEVWQYLQAFFRLLGAYTRQQYTTIPWQSIVSVTAAIVYFVMPVDLIPDLIPVVGFVDDAAVIAFVVARMRADLDAFMAWERAQNALGDQTDQAKQA